MRYFFIILLFHLFCSARILGQNGCIDSISLNQFYPSYFKIPDPTSSSDHNYNPQRDNLDNVYLSGLTTLPGFNNTYWSIIKFNSNNQLLWYKNYRTDLFMSFKRGGHICDIDLNGNLVFFSSSTSPNPFNCTISKTDNAGNLLWSKILRYGTNPSVSGGILSPVFNAGGSLFTIAGFSDDPENPVVTAFSGAGSLLWAKKYSHTTVFKYHRLGSSAITTQDNNTLVMAIYYYYNADSPADPAARFGIQLVKLNATNGSILQQKNYMFFKDISGNVLRNSYLNKFSYNNITKQFLLVSDENQGGRNLAFSLFDENLNHLKTQLYTGDAEVQTGRNNEITMVKDDQGPFVKRFNYAIIDSSLNMPQQRTINLTSLGFPLRNFDVALSYKNNGILNFHLGTFSNFLQDYLFVFDHSPAYNNVSPCVGTDTVIYTPGSVYVLPQPDLTIEDGGSVAFTITDNIPDYPPVDFPLPKTELCKAVSICDTIKLFGTTYHCLSSPLDSFKIFRNPLCVRKTNWQVDTNYIRILSSNDTSLYVQYLRPYRGSIKVGFGGCSLTDQIPIEVYAPKTGLNLGNDTMHCPGKTITLHAGAGFLTYQWQDGSTNESYIAVQPGSYYVSAVDSCGSLFRDTLTVAPFDGVLQVTYPQELCKNDVAVIALPGNLNNYTWQPATGASLSNYTWRLFPSVTTTYTITGERLPGCLLTDTVLVNVKNCPSYILFPNAFTPNNDGLNDLYKPSVVGTLQSYELIIYNRYGQTVFRSKDPNEGWNGIFKNSNKPMVGSYVWLCRYRFNGGQPLQEKGTFTLIR